MSVTQTEEEFNKSIQDESEKATDKVVVESIKAALETTKTFKPETRSERTRVFAVLITDLEKVLAYAKTYLGEK